MNKTQCPHCFTIYVISDEQLRLSQGLVRCGTCRERFQARLMSAQGTPEFNSEKAFIEPISENKGEPSVSPDDFIQPPTEFEFREPVIDEVIARDDNTPISLSPDSESNSFSAAFYEFNDSINSELSIEIADDHPVAVDPEEIEQLEQAIQRELDLPVSAPLAPSTTDQAKQLDSKAPTRDKQLIDEVDQLIEEKLLNQNTPDAKTTTAFTIDESKVTKISQQDQGDDVNGRVDALFTDSKSRSFRPLRALAATALLLVAIVLAAALLYQMWLKQALPWAETIRVQTALKPLQEQLEEMSVDIPIRRNLSQLELLSARAEAHPTRPSTVLLRVSLINRAEISQPLPWLELSLSDADGRLVARRKLAPRDYIFNNRTDLEIGAKQLKKVTIELLAFPKQATGYELRLLNN